MRTRFAFLLTLALSITSALAAPSRIKGFDIPNASLIGAASLAKAKIVRGAQPLGKADVLVDAGITDVLIFKNETKGEVSREIDELIEAGIDEDSITHIPFAWRDVESTEVACEQTLDALEILAEVDGSRGRKVFFHCTAGEDRTGLLAGLYRVMSERTNVSEMYEEEMCERGYADGNTGKPSSVTSVVHKNLTPLYYALAERIAEEGYDLERVRARGCASLEVDPKLAKTTCRSLGSTR